MEDLYDYVVDPDYQTGLPVYIAGLSHAKLMEVVMGMLGDWHSLDYDLWDGLHFASYLNRAFLPGHPVQPLLSTWAMPLLPVEEEI